MTEDSDSTRSRLDRIEALVWGDRPLAAAQAQEWLDELGSSEHSSVSRRLELVLASIEALTGDAGPATATAQSILEWAIEHDDMPLRARCHRMLSVVFFTIVGDSGKSIEHAIAANDVVLDSEPPLMKAAIRMCLADALGAAGSYDESLRHYRETLQIVSDEEPSDFLYALLNNIAYTYFESQDTQAALESVEHMLAVLASSGRPLGMEIRDTAGRIYFAAGLADKAEELLSEAMGPTIGDSGPHSVAVCLIGLAEVYRARGVFDRAQEAIDRCQELCREYELPQMATDALREQAEIFAARGLCREAFEAFQDFHRRSEALAVVRREARGRVLEAAFQTAEAQRESARYRELAEKDPLTGLYNRRYVDEHLGASLMSAHDGRTPMALALVDLDRFKRVNDLCSHEAGDEVLRRVGHILTQRVLAIPGGVAARLGGEEFLLILPGCDAEAAKACAEAVCRAIAEYDWQPITAGIAVTASIGVAVAPADGRRRSELLGIADSRLYAAKRAGRNRVVGWGSAEVASQR